MNTQELDFPVITEPAPAAPAEQAVAVYTGMSAVAVAPLQAMEATLKALADRYRGVAFDLKTTKGLNEAKAARNDLREAGRYAVQRAMNTFKTEANDAKRDVEALAVKMVAITLGIENSIDKDIKARETEIEDEKKAKAAAAAERVAEFEAKIANIRAFLAKARGLPSDRIAKGIEILQGMSFPAEAWAEFAVPAANAQCETVEAMSKLREETVAAELEAQRIEAQRIENERIAAEQAERQKALDAQAAELKRQQEELAAQRAEADRKAEAQAETERKATHYAEQAAVAEAAQKSPAPETPPVVRTFRRVISIDLDNTPPPAIEQLPVPTLKLGTVCDRLGFKLTEAFITDVLQIATKGRDKNAALYMATDFDAICTALINHIKGVAAQ